MATLAADSLRRIDSDWQDVAEIIPIANDIIYNGAAVGDNGSGAARPLVAGDPFMGFARNHMDNAGGLGDTICRVTTKGHALLTVVGAAGVGDVGETVYASDDDTFTLTSTNNTAIGKVARWVTSTTCWVKFEAVWERSL